MRIRKRQVPLPLSSLLPVPLSDLYFNRSPTATARYLCGEDRDGVFASLQLPPPSPNISDRLIPRDVTRKKKKKKKEEDEKALDDDDDDDDNGDGDADVKSSSTDASGSKNVNNPQGEPDSSTQVVEKNEKVVSLRKRRRFISFEEQEEEEEEEDSGGNKGKRKAKKSGALEEGSRCSRVNGRGWRCCQQTLVGYSLCEHHLGKGRVRSMNKSAGGRGGQGGGRGGEKKAVVVEVKKKTVKLGMVKARSIISLLGQTSTSSGNADVIVPTENEISAPADQFAAYDK